MITCLHIQKTPPPIKLLQKGKNGDYRKTSIWYWVREDTNPSEMPPRLVSSRVAITELPSPINHWVHEDTNPSEMPPRLVSSRVAITKLPTQINHWVHEDTNPSEMPPRLVSSRVAITELPSPINRWVRVSTSRHCEAVNSNYSAGSGSQQLKKV